jgi:hypothetical protein
MVEAAAQATWCAYQAAAIPGARPAHLCGAAPVAPCSGCIMQAIALDGPVGAASAQGRFALEQGRDRFAVTSRWPRRKGSVRHFSQWKNFATSQALEMVTGRARPGAGLPDGNAATSGGRAAEVFIPAAEGNLSQAGRFKFRQTTSSGRGDGCAVAQKLRPVNRAAQLKRQSPVKARQAATGHCTE